MTLAVQVFQTINPTIPIVSVRIGDPADKATWQVVFMPNTSQADQDTANALLAQFNPNDAATISAGKDADASVIDSNLVAQALGLALWEEIQKCQVVNGQTLRTKPQMLIRMKAIYRSLL